MAVTDHFDAYFQVNGTRITVIIKTDGSLGTEALNTASARWQQCSDNTTPPYEVYSTASVADPQAINLTEYCFKNLFRFHVTLTDNSGNSYEATTMAYNSGELNNQTFTLDIDVGKQETYDAWVSLEVLLQSKSLPQPTST